VPQMTAMVLTAERRLVLERRPVPTTCANQVLVDVELCGICGSDHVAYIQFLEDSYGTAGSFNTGGAMFNA
jgi:D-arabinose 1-dehydrogenase-like Zn-dependent alcohol dehydrogenase